MTTRTLGLRLLCIFVLAACTPQFDSTVASMEDLAMEYADALDRQARGGPLVVHLTDLDADPVARVVAQIMNRDTAEDTPLLLVAEASPGGEAQRLLDSLAGVAVIRVEPLSQDETSALMTSMLGPSAAPTLAERIHALARGNPILVVELTRRWHAEGEPGLDLGEVSDLDHLVCRTRAWLPRSQRDVVDALAVMAAKNFSQIRGTPKKTVGCTSTRLSFSCSMLCAK